MAIYQLDKIKEDVRIAIDQNMASATLVGISDIDTLSLNEIVRSKVVEGVKRIHAEAPSYLLDGGFNFGDAIYWMDKGSGYILLPEDFMRFVVFQMSDWVRPVFTVLNTDDAEYHKQQSKFKGVRGTYQRPVCFISIRPEGRVLEFYSSKDETAQVSKGVYLPYPYIDENDGIYICSRCYDAVVYMVAASTVTALGDVEKGNVLSELAKSILI